MHPEEQYAVRALRAGASGYHQAKRRARVIGAYPEGLARSKYVTTSLAEKLAVALDSKAEKKVHEKLSTREYQVMLMLASGKSVGEIASELCLSVKTVSTYRIRVMNKMGMKKNAELTFYAMNHHLLNP